MSDACIGARHLGATESRGMMTVAVAPYSVRRHGELHPNTYLVAAFPSRACGRGADSRSRPMADSTPIPPGEQAGAIARHIVRVTAEYTGRGPTKSRATLDEDVITVVLTDNLNKGERSLALAGHAASVIDMRRSFQQAMRQAYTDGVEQITGRTVRAFLSDHSIEPDIAVEIFILSPQDQ